MVASLVMALHWAGSFPWIWAAVVSSSPSAVTVENLSAQALLVAGVTYMTKEYRDERKKREELVSKMMSDIIPLLTRSTEAIESVSYLYQSAVGDSRPPHRRPPRSGG